MARGSRPDMEACVALFEALELEVKSIYVSVGKRSRTVSLTGLDGEWFVGGAALSRAYSPIDAAVRL